MLSETSIPRKSARHNGNKGQQPHYDMSWHSADEQIRPQAAAARRKRQRVSEQEDDKGKVGICATSPVNERPIDQDIVDPRRENTTPEMLRVWPDDGCRRSTRAKTSDTPLYSARYHPADAVLRPAAAAKYLSTRSQPVSPSKQGQSPPADSPSRRLMSSQVRTKYSDRLPLPQPDPVTEPTDFQRLPNLDRRMLQLQKCVPSGAEINMMPGTWEHISDVLHNEALISWEQASSEQIVESIRTRYESARSAVTAYFKSDPEPGDKRDWVVFRAENFDVFDHGRGQKYWPYYQKSIVLAIGGGPVQHLSAMHAGSAKPEEWGSNDGKIEGPLSTVTDPRHVTSPPIMLTGGQAAEAAKQTLTGVYDPTMSQSEHHFLPERADCAERSALSAFGNGNEEDIRFRRQSLSMTSREGSPQASIQNFMDTPIEDDGDIADILKPSLDCLATGAAARGSSIKVLINNEVPPQWRAERIRPSEDRQGQTYNKATIGRHSGQYRTRHHYAESITIAEDAPGTSPKIKRLVESYPLSHGSDIPKENLASQERLETSDSPSSRALRDGRRNARNGYRSSFGDVNRHY